MVNPSGRLSLNHRARLNVLRLFKMKCFYVGKDNDLEEKVALLGVVGWASG